MDDSKLELVQIADMVEKYQFSLLLSKCLHRLKKYVSKTKSTRFEQIIVSLTW